MSYLGSLTRKFVELFYLNEVVAAEDFMPGETILISKKCNGNLRSVIKILTRSEAELAYQSHIDFIDAVGDDLVSRLNDEVQSIQDDDSDYFSDSILADEIKAQMEEKLHRKVYLIRQGNEYKIGVSGRPEKRMDEVTSPSFKDDKKELLLTIDHADPMKLERHLHRIFSHKKIQSEWFSLSDIDIEWIKCSAELLSQLDL